ncbi:protein FAM13A-like, partial [Centroberyx affinis]|uniref:protein FAM13A-like n=1 Tax=Centroberyx affinis TaxID=166261 RepID=UPI003A5BEB82
VAPGFEAMKDQNICNKIMAKLIQNYSSIFESNTDRDRGGYMEELTTLIIVKEAHMMDIDTKKSANTINPKTPTPVPRKKVGHRTPPDSTEPLNKSSTKTPTARPRKKKVRKGKGDNVLQVVPQPSRSAGLPHVRPLHIAIPIALTSELRSPSPEAMEMAPAPPAQQDPPGSATHLAPPDVSPSGSMETLSSSQEEERPISPFYM